MAARDSEVKPNGESVNHVRLPGGLFLEVSSHIQGRLMQSSHGGEGGDTRMLIFLALED
ncbi:hypothetical protein YC2023_113539 [Brassica napus]